MIGGMDKDWARLGRMLADARKPRTQTWVAHELDVGRTTIQKIEAGQVYKKLQPVHRSYARLVGWTDESPDLVLEGGDPVLRPAPQSPASEHHDQPAITAPDLSLRVTKSLQEGPLLDAQIITVQTPGGPVRATIVVRGEPDTSPDDQLKALHAWRDREDALRRLGDTSGDAPESGS